MTLKGVQVENRKRPDVEISYFQFVGAEDIYLGMGTKDPGTTSSDGLKIKVALPKEKLENIELDVTSDSRVLETKEYLQVQMWEFEGLLKSLSSPDLQSSSFIPYNPLSRISRDEDDVDNDELLKVAKLIRLQQFMTCLNSMLGPGTAPLPAQMPPKICFKLKPQTVSKNSLIILRKIMVRGCI